MSEKLIFRDSDFVTKATPSPTSRTVSTNDRTVSTNDDEDVIFIESYDDSSVIQTSVLDHKISIAKPEMRTEGQEGNSLAYYYANPYYNYIALEWEENFSTLPALRVPNLYVEALSGVHTDELKMLANKTTRDMAKRFNKNLRRHYRRISNSKLNRYKNIMFSSRMFGASSSRSLSPSAIANKFKNNYPFYNELYFYQNSNTSVVDKMLEMNMFDLLLEDYISATKQTRRFGNQSVKIYDLKQWTLDSDLVLDNRDKIILNKEAQGLGAFSPFLKRKAFFGFLRSMVKDHQRTAAQVMRGTPAYSEVLFHRIEKVKSSNGQVVQSYWVPASKGRIQVVDTQIKYGEEYDYRHFTYLFVIGANIESIETGQISVSPSIQIAEVPMYTQECIIVQPPQPPPEVRFYNNRNRDNEIRIGLSLNANDYYKNFIPLNSNEEAQDSVISKYNPAGNKRYFNYETEHGLFEVFRTEKQPENFDDIGQFKISEVKSTTPSISTMITDRILFDKEYFYTFRSINTHGLFSNPSPIFKVVLLKDADETFVRVEAVGLLNKPTTQDNIMFQKLLQLVPSSLHTIYDFNDSGFTSLRGKIDDITLGIAQERIWGEKFKFRITSKDTGKKIDLNVTVNLTKNKSEEDL